MGFFAAWNHVKILNGVDPEVYGEDMRVLP
jgi:hypothetical protein